MAALGRAAPAQGAAERIGRRGGVAAPFTWFTNLPGSTVESLLEFFRIEFAGVSFANSFSRGFCVFPVPG